METINLAKAPAQTELEIIEVDSETGYERRLASMGIRIGDKLVKLNDVSWGPILVKNISQNASKIGVGRGIAEKIFVMVSN